MSTIKTKLEVDSRTYDEILAADRELTIKLSKSPALKKIYKKRNYIAKLLNNNESIDYIANKINVTGPTLRKALKDETIFKAVKEETDKEYLEKLERSVRQRALEGNAKRKYVMSRGELKLESVEVSHSDALTQFMLRNLDPEKYNKDKTIMLNSEEYNANDIPTIQVNNLTLFGDEVDE